MNKPMQFDALVGVLGVALSVSVFFAQGGGGSLAANLFGLSPLLLALIWIYLRRLLRRIARIQGALAMLTNARLDTNMVIKIENAQGDVRMEKRIRIEASKDGAGLSFTKNEVLFSEVPIAQIPPPATVIRASNPRVALRPRYVDKSEVDVGGSRNHRYDWRYEISPPIEQRGHFVEFAYEVDIPRCEASAFTAAGGKIFYDHSAFETEAEVSLFSPAGYRIVISRTYLELSDGSQEPCSAAPQLPAGGHLLSWKPQYKRGARSVCEYRLVASVAPAGATP
ncbi:MAG: hypothetical protein ABW005_04820 [Burkholderiaceae bacterium]